MSGEGGETRYFGSHLVVATAVVRGLALAANLDGGSPADCAGRRRSHEHEWL